MRRFSLTAFLMLSAACVFAIADDSLKPPVRSTAADRGQDFPPVTDAGLENTQIGALNKVKLDRAKTQLNLYENSRSIIKTERKISSVYGFDTRLVTSTAVDPNTISISALKPGRTSLVLADETKKLYHVEITVVGDTRPLQAQLKKLYPRASIQAVQIGESVLLRGTVTKPEHIKEVVEISEQFYAKVLNQLKPAKADARPAKPNSGDKPSLPALLKKLYPRASIQAIEIGDDVLLRGTVTKPEHIREIVEISERYYARVLNLLKLAVTTVRSPNPKALKVVMQTHVLEIDWKRLAESKVDLGGIISAFASSPAPRDRGKASKWKPPFLAVAVPSNTTDGIIRLLAATKAVKVVCRPQITTMVGRPASVCIGPEIPIIANEEIRNGEQPIDIEFRRVGTTLEVTPQPGSADKMKMAVVVEHSQRIGNTITRLTGTNAVPKIRTRKFNLGVELKAGQSLILAETGPSARTENDPTIGKGLMILLTHHVVPGTPTALPPGTNGRAANVVRPRRGQPPTPRARPPIQPTRYNVPRSKPQGLSQSVRELRGEVRALHRDVGRLLKLLQQKKLPGTNGGNPTALKSNRKSLIPLKTQVPLKTDDSRSADPTAGPKKKRR